MPKKANVGDTIRTKSGDEFIVLKEEVDDHDTQWVWRCNCDEGEECNYFSRCSYGVPDTNFEVIKNGEEI